MLISTANAGAAMTVTALCGVLVPTSSSAMTNLMPLRLTENGTKQATTVDAAVTEPSFVPEVIGRMSMEVLEEVGGGFAGRR